MELLFVPYHGGLGQYVNGCKMVHVIGLQQMFYA